MRVPSGCQAGLESMPAAFVSRSAVPPSVFIVHSQPRAEKASLRPSGDTAGYVGPTE